MELQTNLAKLEHSAKTTDIDIWLSSWIKIESIAKASNYTWASQIIDHFHAAAGCRSVFSARTFAAHIWIVAITLPQWPEQYRLCDAKSKGFQLTDAQELQGIFTPPIFLAAVSHDTNKSGSKHEDKITEMKNMKCVCGFKNHKLAQCRILNINSRPKTWVNSRSFSSKKRLRNILTDMKKKELERKLAHKIPNDLLEIPIENTPSAANTIGDNTLHVDYISESSTDRKSVV